MSAVLRREFSSFFKSPIGYVYLAVYTLIAGFYFYALVAMQSTQISMVYSSLFIFSCILVPILTMKLFSDEKKQKTDQLLLTSPVSLSGLVYGKFFATFFVYAIGVSVTLVYALILAGFGELDWMVMLGNYVGLLLLGAAMIAIGELVSSVTESQIIAVILSLIVTIALLLLDSIISMFGIAFLTDIISAISITQRYTEFTNGLFDISNVIFFASIVVICNFITVRILEKKRWS
ncbi:MAG: ABC transporter permease subunit [Oscillospiraceae bacterium]|nr:ABC transporter permease subunit [Oscillospiraceae bacterium]